MAIIKDYLKGARAKFTFSGVPEGLDAKLLAEAAQGQGDLIFVARDDGRMAKTIDALKFFAPNLSPIGFPAWDCLPYDRVSPKGEIVSQRIEALSRLLHPSNEPRLIVTTVSAIQQKVPPRQAFEGKAIMARVGDLVSMNDLISALISNGYLRTDKVMETGEFAVRGGILDVFPGGFEEPVRLDFFGDELENIRSFDPMSQRSQESKDSFSVIPVSEIFLDNQNIECFRNGYRALFGNVGQDDPLYAAVSEGRRYGGMEHWLPLFYDTLESLFDYAPDASVILDHQVDEVLKLRLEQIDEYYEARKSFVGAGSQEAPYHPIPPERLYLSQTVWSETLNNRPTGALTPFSEPERAGICKDLAGRKGKDFAEARANPNINVFDALSEHLAALAGQSKRVLLAAWTEGSRDRLSSVLKEHGLDALIKINDWKDFEGNSDSVLGLAVLGIENGFESDDLAVITEQDILGDRIARPAQRRMRAENFISEASALNEDDLVVHVEHGIGIYKGLETLTVSGAPHDCLRVVYAGDDKLFVPVENIEVLSRYGTDQGAAQLDKLGGVAWQARKAKLKQRVKDIADKLIAVAAQRELRKGESLPMPEGLFDEFCARFPYSETDGQLNAIADTMEDLASGRSMDRLVCGDVGFGKTEVALRAAFVAAMAGKQIAVIVPTTLLCRQHFKNFSERFRGYPIRVEQISRMVPPAQIKKTKEGLADGTVDIVVGTHALLAKGIDFDRLGLLIIDEEQHFGVSHKEKLKQLKADIHVLTLTATPIPRTLQMALAGVKEMSLIATPPVDRLAVRTFVLPFDPVVIREAIQRERYRGGQVFYVCPRIADIDKVAQELESLVPDAKVGIAHGRMKVGELEDVMNAFSEQKLDILLCTNIIESGLDMPTANTLIVHRADMFGLAQLYQIRGRVGRSKTRAYAYLTLPPRQKVTASAEKRLEVMQTLDTLGAGFTLASHDLDIRGAGNLLGEEQSGHIREVGVELYQKMLEEAVAEAKGPGDEEAAGEQWSPQINLGMPVLIPETYVADLGVRLGLYRRLGEMAEQGDIDSFAAELVDRFGSLPSEVENLLQILSIKLLCKKAGIEKIDAGPKGGTVTFRNNTVENPQGLVEFITSQSGTAKLKPDHKLVLMRNWERTDFRIAGAKRLAADLAALNA